jgi:two-component system sensor histidine kinase DevS
VTEARESPLEAALEVNQAMLEGLPLRRLLLLIARRAQAVVRASLVAVCTPAADGSGQAVRTAIGRGAERLRGWTIPAQDPEASELLRAREGWIVALDAGPWPHYLPAGLSGRLGSALLVPLVVRERTLGLLLLAHPAGGQPFSEDDLALVQLFGAQVAVAVEYQRSRAAMVEVGLAEDRERIARELHDGVVQALYGVGLALQTALPLARTPAVRSHLEGAVEDIDEVVAQLRAHIGQLRPTVLPDRGLELAIRRVAARVSDRSHMAIEVDIVQDVAARLANHREQLLLIVKERLSDLVRRADIAHCRIRLRQDRDRAVLEIGDDGRGVHSEDARLRKLRQLVAVQGGDVDVEIAPELGSTLRATVRAGGHGT